MKGEKKLGGFFDLFKSFDFCSGVFLWEIFGCFKWFSFLFLVTLRFISETQVTKNRKSNFFLIFSLFTRQTSYFSIWNFWLFFSFVMWLIIYSKFLGLVPYFFSNTSHIVFVLFVAVSSWGRIFLSNFVFKPLIFFYLFFPSSPGFILPFLNVIEVISFFIRPITLTLRLSIKITTGHIFVAILSNSLGFVLLSGSPFFFFLLPIRIFLCFFEKIIGFIQGAVFSLLLKSYYAEHRHYVCHIFLILILF